MRQGQKCLCNNTQTLRAEKKKKGPTQSSVQVIRMQMWTDLLASGVDQDKIDRQPNAVLIELWRQLKPKQ